MTIGEYEERFRRLAPSWHQILTVAQSPNQTRRRRLRCLVGAALLGLMAVTMEIASHHAAHSHAGRGAARQPFDGLPGDFWHILDRGWTDRGPPGPNAKRATHSG